jgi:hypothetical protein
MGQATNSFSLKHSLLSTRHRGDKIIGKLSYAINTGIDNAKLRTKMRKRNATTRNDVGF